MTYGVGMIGMGKISDVHIEGWQKLPDAEVKILVDVDASRASEKAKKYNVARSDTEYKAALNLPGVDIIDIYLPRPSKDVTLKSQCPLRDRFESRRKLFVRQIGFHFYGLEAKYIFHDIKE